MRQLSKRKAFTETEFNEKESCKIIYAYKNSCHRIKKCLDLSEMSLRK